MGFITSVLSGDKGAGYTAGGVDAGKNGLVNATTQPQADTAYQQTQSGLQQQQAFLNALQAQNGINNQSSVFNQQQALSAQLQGVANGTGPNPAQAALNQATGNNVANQAALMAGQRGSSSNAGLIARQAGQQGANIQQQAVGQGASMQAQQQIAGMNALAAQQANMANLATQQVGQQAGATTGYNQLAQGQQQNILGGIQGQNNANASVTSSQNSANSSIAGQNAKTQGGLVSGLLGGVGGAIGMAEGGMVPDKEPKFADGGMLGMAPLPAPSMPMTQPIAAPITPAVPVQMPAAQGPKSAVGRTLKGLGGDPAAMGGPQFMGDDAAYNGGYQLGTGLMKAGKGMLGGNSVDPNGLGKDFAGESYGLGVDGVSSAGGGGYGLGMAADSGGIASMLGEVGPAAMALAKGGEVEKDTGEKLAKEMKPVPGKAKVKGDSYSNDKVDAKLSPGEIVIPRSITQGPNPAEKAAAFVNAILARQHLKGKASG